MANDITGIIDSLSNNANRLEKIKDAKDLADVIDNLLSLANESASYGGEIARVVPLNIKNILEPLNRVYEDYKSTLSNALSEFNKIVEYIDNIPLGQLRQKSIANSISSQNTPNVQDSINNIPVAPQNNGAPQSAIVNNNASIQNESLTLKALFDRDFAENSEVYEKFDNSMLDKITENVDLSILDSDDFEMSPNDKEYFDDDVKGNLMEQLEEKTSNTQPLKETTTSMSDALNDLPVMDLGI